MTVRTPERSWILLLDNPHPFLPWYHPSWSTDVSDTSTDLQLMNMVKYGSSGRCCMITSCYWRLKYLILPWRTEQKWAERVCSVPLQLLSAVGCLTPSQTRILWFNFLSRWKVSDNCKSISEATCQPQWHTSSRSLPSVSLWIPEHVPVIPILSKRMLGMTFIIYLNIKGWH